MYPPKIGASEELPAFANEAHMLEWPQELEPLIAAVTATLTIGERNPFWGTGLLARRVSEWCRPYPLKQRPVSKSEKEAFGDIIARRWSQAEKHKPELQNPLLRRELENALTIAIAKHNETVRASDRRRAENKQGLVDRKFAHEHTYNLINDSGHRPFDMQDGDILHEFLWSTIYTRRRTGDFVGALINSMALYTTFKLSPREFFKSEWGEFNGLVSTSFCMDWTAEQASAWAELDWIVTEQKWLTGLYDDPTLTSRLLANEARRTQSLEKAHWYGGQALLLSFEARPTRLISYPTNQDGSAWFQASVHRVKAGAHASSRLGKGALASITVEQAALNGLEADRASGEAESIMWGLANAGGASALAHKFDKAQDYFEEGKTLSRTVTAVAAYERLLKAEQRANQLKLSCRKRK